MPELYSPIQEFIKHLLHADTMQGNVEKMEIKAYSLYPQISQRLVPR